MFGKWDKSLRISSKGRIAWRIVKAFYVSGGGKGKKNMHIPFVSLHKDYYRLETLLSRVINDAQDVRQIFEWYLYTHRISSGRISRGGRICSLSFSRQICFAEPSRTRRSF